MGQGQFLMSEVPLYRNAAIPPSAVKKKGAKKENLFTPRRPLWVFYRRVLREC